MPKTLVDQSMNLGMGTVMTHRAFVKHAEESLRAVGVEAVRLEKMLSRFVPVSKISRINRFTGMKCERLSRDTYEVMSRTIEFSRSCKRYLIFLTI